MWFRRDLRLRDNPALSAAAADGGVLALYVLDPALWGPAGGPRRTYLLHGLQALDASTGGHLHLRRGDPVEQVVRAAADVSARAVHIAADFGPYGRRRDAAVERALAARGIALVRTGSPYAVSPGRVSKSDGEPYSVYTPFYRAWRTHGWRAPATDPAELRWTRATGSDQLPVEPPLPGLSLPPSGEEVARRRWANFRDSALADYADNRNRPDLDGTSQLSHHLKWGEIHPRTLLADLSTRQGTGVETYRKELAWREFYADVLFRRPDSAREHFRPDFAAMRYDDADDRLAAWREGRTGYPFVDAGMRQLRTEGWMHNRLRMVVASFLVKDLHVGWRHGSRHFLRWLRDGDLASNNHGWQWVAGSGTDAAPYYRVFNPVTQGLRFDPTGEYVRRHVVELRHLPGATAHEPWEHPDGYAHGYPHRLVDHGVERVEALARYAELREA